jgi:hypothetical protein
VKTKIKEAKVSAIRLLDKENFIYEVDFKDDLFTASLKVSGNSNRKCPLKLNDKGYKIIYSNYMIAFIRDKDAVIFGFMK